MVALFIPHFMVKADILENEGNVGIIKTCHGLKLLLDLMQSLLTIRPLYLYLGALPICDLGTTHSCKISPPDTKLHCKQQQK